MPDITDIPQSAQLQQQLNMLNQAIAFLQDEGTVDFITVNSKPTAPPPPDATAPSPAPPGTVLSVRVNLNPPISDPGTTGDLAAALQTQADAITQQLTDMGYSNNARLSR